MQVLVVAIYLNNMYKQFDMSHEKSEWLVLMYAGTKNGVDHILEISSVKEQNTGTWYITLHLKNDRYPL